MSINCQIENFHKSLMDLINNANLPVGIVFYIYKDIFLALREEYSKTLQDEQNLKETDITVNISADGEFTIDNEEE